jgi:phage protein D
MTDALMTAPAPVFEIDGVVKGELARDLLRLEVEETTAGLKTLSARFVAQGPNPRSPEETQLYLDGSLIDFGKKLAVAVGFGEAARTVFKGVVSGLEAVFHEKKEPEVHVFAEDGLMKLRMTRRLKTYEHLTDAQIAEAIAHEHGLTPETDADGPTYDVVQQWNMSDLAFLRERARLIQAEVWCRDDTLYFKTRDKRNAPGLTLVQGNHLIVVQARADLAHQRTSVTVSGYDARERAAIDEEAGSEAIDGEVSGGRTGVSVLQRAFGERVSYRVREAPLTGPEARAFARAEMLRRARAFVTVVGTTRGSPDLTVGSRLTLERVGTPFNGPGYYVTRVCHTYDPRNNGLRTRFEAERATVQEGV